MNLKHILILLFSVPLLFSSCEKDADLDDMEFSPTVRCIVNSIDFQSNLIEVNLGNNAIQFSANAGDKILTIQIETPIAEGTYPLDGTTISQAVYSDISNSIEYISDDGSIMITRYDPVSKEIEGTFQFHGIEFFGSGEIFVIDGQLSALIP